MPNTNIKQLYGYILQQMAAESYFEGNELNSIEEIKKQLYLGANREGYKTNNTDLNEGYPGYTRMTKQQADEFLDKFKIVHQWSDNPTPTGKRPLPEGIDGKPKLNAGDLLANTGLSATLIQDKATGAFTLAIRSTEFRDWSKGGDGERDKAGADIESIATKGFALAQLAALEQYYEWLKNNGKLPASAQLNVTGYSLGGHLATVFTEIHRSDKDISFGETVTFNGAGRGTWNNAAGSERDIIAFYQKVLIDPEFAPNPGGGIATSLREAARGKAGQAFDDKNIYTDPRHIWAMEAAQIKFGLSFQSLEDEYRTGTLADDKITQVFGYETINNTNMTANSGVHGPALRVGIESQPILEGALAGFIGTGDFGNGHSITLIADSLALQRAMHQVDSSFNLDKFIQLLPAASHRKTTNGVNANYEFDALENLLDPLRKLVFGDNTPTTPFKEGASGFGDINKRADFHENIKILVESEGFKKIAGKAKIHPIPGVEALVSKASQNNAEGIAYRYALKNLNPFAVEGADYDAHNKGKELDRYDAGTQTGQLTDQWIEDRAAMLGWLAKRNSENNNDTTIKAPQDLRFLDEARKIDLRLGSSTTGDDNRKQFHFGDGKANTLTGASKEDHLYGGSGADTLEGKDGADYLEGGADADTYVLQTGLTGIDTLVDSGSNTLQVDGKTVSGAFAQVAGMGGDIYYSADKSYQLRKAENGVWRLAAKNEGTGQYSAVADLKNWKDGDYGLTIGAPTQEPERIAPVVYPNSVAYLAMDGAAAPKGVTFGGGTKSDSFNGSAHDDVITTGGGLSNYVMAFAGDDMVVGGDGKDFIRTGQNASSPTFKDNDIAFGGENRDVLMGGGGDDQLWGEYIDSANESAGADSGEYGDWVSGELGNDTISGSRKGDVLFGGAGQDIAKGGAGDDLILGDGHYTPFSKSIALDYAESITQSFIWDDARQDMVKVTPGNYGLHPVTIASGQAFDWTWTPTAQNDYELKAPVGLISDKRVAADGGDDRLFGGEGADWMAGQTGNDTLFGGEGNDTMYGDDLGMADADAGQDLMYGDAGNDKMYGGAKEDVLDGGQGDDKLYGEAGNDFLLGDTGDDELSGNEGADTLDGGAGADRLLGGEDDDQLWGADGDDTLDGGAGANLLHGGRGKDQLLGGAGDDTYLFEAGDDAGVVSTATDSEGNNTVQLTGGALKDMQLTGSDSAWLLRYTKDDSVQLNGSFKVQWGGRSHTLAEFAKAIEDASKPDTPPPPANSAPSVAKPLQNASAVEFVPLVLPIVDGTFTDPDKNDKLTYSASLVGGAALPAWLVFDAPTRTLRGTPDGNAAGTLQVRITATDAAGLSASSDFELAISDAPPPPVPHTIVGTPGDDTLKGSAGADAMRGDGGNDTLQGLGGDDELHGEDGQDTLRAGDGADKLYGGADGDALYGDAGDDVLDGGAGDDTLQGGLGNDTYLFGRGDGQDTLKGQNDATPGKLNTLRFKDGVAAADIQASRDGTALVLAIAGTGDNLRVEQFFTSNDPGNDSNPLQQVQFADGTVWDLASLTQRASTGTSASEVLKGTNGADTIYAGADNDTLQGLGGDDELHGEDGQDTLRAGEGADKLYGGADGDALYGDAGDDVLDGGAGNDTLQGGLGNDTYLFGRGDGQDTLKGLKDTTPGKLNTLRFKDGVAAADIQASRDGTALVLAVAGSSDSVRVENYFTSNDPGNDSNPLQQVQFADGTVWSQADMTARAGVGTDASEVLKGTNGADTLYAGAGNDTLQGLGGDDELHGDEGEDTLRAGDGADKLYGGADGDTLYGDAGDDVLDGGAGNDTLQGGLGNDTYLFGRDHGVDRITENDSTPGNTDVLQFGAGVAADQLWFRRVGSNLEVSIIGSSDTCTISQWYSADVRHVEQFRTADGKVLLDSQVNNLVQAMAAFAPPPAGQSTLAAHYQTALHPVLASNWH